MVKVVRYRDLVKAITTKSINTQTNKQQHVNSIYKHYKLVLMILYGC